MSEHAHKVAIVGAGITGLTAADRLAKAGRSVHVFDKGRARGGRISTRHTVRGLFDHGAPGLEVRDEDFSAFLESLGATVDQKGARFGGPGMQSMFDMLGADFTIRQDVEIADVRRDTRGWVLRAATGRSLAYFDDVILTIPAPQAAKVLFRFDPALAREIEQVRMHPVWSCLVEFAAEISPSSVPAGGPVLRADRMGSKPARSDGRSAWVIHMTPEFTEMTLHADPIMMAPYILEIFATTCGFDLPGVLFLDAHRWRYAFAEQPLGRPYLVSKCHGLHVGGDWTLGRRAEDGFNSGRAMADSVLSRVATSV